MKRLVAFALIVVLSLTLALPAVAVAKGGPPAGKGPGSTPPGQAKKAAPAAAEDAAEEAGASEEESAGEPAPAGRAADKAAKKAEKAAKKAEKAAAKSERAEVKAQKKGAGAAAASVEESGSVETSGPAEPGEGEEPEAPVKLTGIANALSRIMANIERAEARVAEGKQSAVPAGLLRVLAKFMGWLGIEAEPEPDPVGEDPAIEDPTEGSEEETGTLLPETGSEEDTETAAPELAE